ncbi:MAG: response regulator [candidate division Zixibacteria bacterium]|nr:response regulator [candidate division Zixibacteria bacterium]
MSAIVDDSKSRKYKILIVDDEQIILNIASDVLKTEGYEITTSNDPLKALELLNSQKFDFLLTDIKMPNMDGMTLAREAQKIDPDLGTVFMTGYASLDTAKEAIKTGAYDYIMKPFELTELRNAIKKATDKKTRLEESSGGQDLKRLSDLMEVLYNVGDRDSLLKLSLGLALLNCSLEVGMIAAWDARSSKLDLAATQNVKEGAFKMLSRMMRAGEIESCFQVESPLRTTGMTSNEFFANLIKVIPEAESYAGFFREDASVTTLAVNSRNHFHVVLLLQESSEEPLHDRDLKLLSIVLSLISLAAENIALFEESQKALSELEKLHDDIVNLEKVATKGIMSAEIGHELNNFLNIVRSNFEILSYKAKIENMQEVEKYIESINGSLDQMTRFTSGLVDSANLKTEIQSINLNELIEDIVSFLSPQKRFREIKLNKYLDTSTPAMMADPSQLSQLFYNILNNAAQALKKHDDSKIDIHTNFDPEKEEVVIEVRDNGPGIPQDLVDKAFTTRFTTKSEGHGFGLIVCAKVVANHNGKIKVRRGNEGGTIFTIKLPLEAPSEENRQDDSEIARIRV